MNWWCFCSLKGRGQPAEAQAIDYCTTIISVNMDVTCTYPVCTWIRQVHLCEGISGSIRRVWWNVLACGLDWRLQRHSCKWKRMLLLLPLALLLLCGGRLKLHLLFVLPYNPTGCSLIRFCMFRSSNLCFFLKRLIYYSLLWQVRGKLQSR